MDSDLLTNILNDEHSILSGTLLSHVPPTSISPFQAGALVSKIESIFEQIADCVLDEKKNLVIKLKTRGKQSIIARDTTSGIIKSVPDTEARLIRFPSKSPKEAWKFTTLLRILELSHEALVTGVVITKRDMFYRDPELFVKQAIVDRYVDDLAYTLGVERDAMNVVAAAKGLIAGNFKVIRNDESILNYASEPEGILISNSRNVKSVQLLNVKWILVIEKEATFRTLATNKYWESSQAGKGIIVTAKGYPDIQTRQFLHLLSIHNPPTPIFALVDFDPDGLGIMSTYKYGSAALAHENQNLAVPSIKWVGVRSSDIVQGSSDKTGLMKLSGRDRRIATLMLEKETFDVEGREQEWRRELQVMLMMNIKAEIQILSSGAGLEIWLDEKLLEATS